MTHVLVKSPQAASPWMLALSVALHGLAILAVILSVALFRQANPSNEVITSVRLVEAPAGNMMVEKSPQGPTKPETSAPSEELELTPVAAEPPEPVRHTVQAAASVPPEKHAIPLKKRKKPLQRVEAPKQPEKKKEAEAPKKKESPENLLEKRLASIRKEIENRKSDASAKSSAAAQGKTGVQGTKDGGTVYDEELALWLEGVRDRINSRWSILADQKKLRRVTVIGVKVAESGRLVEATVNDSSGDDVFDASALRAVFQADPFPRVPSAVMERIRKAGGLALRFTPGGMQ